MTSDRDCPKCGMIVLERESSCPNCGFQLDGPIVVGWSPTVSVPTGIALILGAVWLAYVLAVAGGNSGYTNRAYTSENFLALAVPGAFALAGVVVIIKALRRPR